MTHRGGFQVLDPTADTAEARQRTPRRMLRSLRKARIGFVWGQHVSTTVFWPILEQTIEAMYEPVEVVRLYKSSTWNPAPQPALDEVLRRIDYAITGVGG